MIRLRNLAFAGIAMAACMRIEIAVAQADTGALSVRVLTIEGFRDGPRKLDFVNAKPTPLPINPEYSPASFKKDLIAALNKTGSFDRALRFFRFDRGDGKRLPGDLKVGKLAASAAIVKQQYGTANLPYSTARADLDPEATNTQWPYRAAGMLFYKKVEDRDFWCSAALIHRGLVVTAAHCVVDYGTKRRFSNWEFIPGYRDGAAPFGTWNALKAYVTEGYADGSTPCDYKGAVCPDDIAILALAPQKDAQNKPFFAGERTGWFAYASGPAPFTASGLVHVTQLGYPYCLDEGRLMQRNDSQGVISPDSRDNTVIGSLMCGGSSGGPWVVNLGIEPALTDTIGGVFPKANVVIGVTSWGSSDNTVKEQGASPFLASNIDFLVKAACKDYPDACKP